MSTAHLEMLPVSLGWVGKRTFFLFISHSTPFPGDACLFDMMMTIVDDGDQTWRGRDSLENVSKWILITRTLFLPFYQEMRNQRDHLLCVMTRTMTRLMRWTSGENDV